MPYFLVGSVTYWTAHGFLGCFVMYSMRSIPEKSFSPAVLSTAWQEEAIHTNLTDDYSDSTCDLGQTNPRERGTLLPPPPFKCPQEEPGQVTKGCLTAALRITRLSPFSFVLSGLQCCYVWSAKTPKWPLFSPFPWKDSALAAATQGPGHWLYHQECQCQELRHHLTHPSQFNHMTKAAVPRLLASSTSTVIMERSLL